jgi:hypothetical protein
MISSARRKQGGSQSLNDNAKGNAKSAGALLRRYGEQALRDVSIADISPWLIYSYVSGYSQPYKGLGG